MICPRTGQAFLGSVDLLDGKVQVLAASKKHPSKRGGARSGVQPRVLDRGADPPCRPCPKLPSGRR